MLTVLIETKDSEEALARTLGSLISGAVEGIVRDVVVRDRGSADHTCQVAEHAGCIVTTAPLASVLAEARAEWLLVLEPGARLADGWIEPVRHHLGGQEGAACFAGAGNDGLLARLRLRGRPLAYGLVVRKSAALAVKAVEVEALARGMRKRRLDARLFPAPA